MRVRQPEGQRGSLKWMQRAVAERWPTMEGPLLARLSPASVLDWLSPLADDDWAEYRDAAFLNRLGLHHIAPALADFWPDRGPQWDGLARTAAGQVVLVEAKAHIAEFCSPATQAGAVSRGRIEAACVQTAEHLGSSRGALWPELFYQYANRLAHLFFLRSNSVDAYLLLVGFLGDREMRGPVTAETWEAAYAVADHALGLTTRHPLKRYVVHVHPQVPHE